MPVHWFAAGFALVAAVAAIRAARRRSGPDAPPVDLILGPGIATGAVAGAVLVGPRSGATSELATSLWAAPAMVGALLAGLGVALSGPDPRTEPGAPPAPAAGALAGGALACLALLGTVALGRLGFVDAQFLLLAVAAWAWMVSSGAARRRPGSGLPFLVCCAGVATFGAIAARSEATAPALVAAIWILCAAAVRGVGPGRLSGAALAAPMTALVALTVAGFVVSGEAVWRAGSEARLAGFDRLFGLAEGMAARPYLGGLQTAAVEVGAAIALLGAALAGASRRPGLARALALAAALAGTAVAFRRTVAMIDHVAG